MHEEHVEIQPKYTHPWKTDVSIGETPVGKGVFAARPFPASAVIGEITGDLFNDPDYGSSYCFSMDEGWVLEPSAPFRFINHCCEPNCEFDWFDTSLDGNGNRAIYVIALRDIAPGEELTIDFNWSSNAAIPCGCKSANCRGWVVSIDELDKLGPRAASFQRGAPAQCNETKEGDNHDTGHGTTHSGR